MSFVLQKESRRLKCAKCPQSGFAVEPREVQTGFRQVQGRRLSARLIVEDSARDHPQFLASLTLWQPPACRNQWQGSSVTDITNLPLTGCQQCSRCRRHSHVFAVLCTTQPPERGAKNVHANELRSTADYCRKSES